MPSPLPISSSAQGSPQILHLPRAPGSCHQPRCLCTLTSPAAVCFLQDRQEPSYKEQHTATRIFSAAPQVTAQNHGLPLRGRGSAHPQQPLLPVQPFSSLSGQQQTVHPAQPPAGCRGWRPMPWKQHGDTHTHKGRLCCPLPPRLRDALPSLTLHPDPCT